MLKATISLCLMAAVLAGCSSLTPAGMIAAMRLDPLETPPGNLTVALGVPDALIMQDGDAQFRLAFQPEDPTAAVPVDTTVPLTLLDDANGPRAAAAGEAIYVFGFSPQDAALVSAAQKQILALKEQQIDGDGKMNITIVGGCLTRDLGGSLPVSTWLRSDPQASFAPLIRRVDFFDVLPAEERAQLEAALVPC